MSSKRKLKVGHEVKWYVRPSGGSYGAEDGTSYANAWDGFADITWANIKAGDTLYVAGTHYSASGGVTLSVGTSGTTNHHVTVASCEVQYGASDDDAGTIWGAKLFTTAGWTGPTNGVYSRAHATHPYLFAVETNGNVLHEASSVETCEQTVGSFWASGGTMYYHPTADGLREIAHYGGGALSINRKNHVTVKGLRLFYGTQSTGPLVLAKDSTGTDDKVRHITVDGCEIAYGTHNAISALYSIEDIFVQNCTIYDCSSGFYHVAKDFNPTPDVTGNSYRVTIRDNEFYHTENRLKVGPYTDSPGDELCAGSLGGINEFTITGNYVHDWRGEGFNCYASYASDGVTMHDLVISHNWVELVDDIAGRMLMGIAFWGENSTDLGDRLARGKAHNNVVIGAVLTSYESAASFNGAVRVKATEMTDPADRIQIYNNTFVGCYAGLNYANAGQVNDACPVIFKNNIVAEPEAGGYFVKIAATDVDDQFVADYNDFSGVASWQWDGGADISTLAAWRTASSQDANSITDAPLFVSASDYALQAGSPCVNSGTDTDLTDDYAGNPRPVGGYDIGAYEGQA